MDYDKLMMAAIRRANESLHDYILRLCKPTPRAVCICHKFSLQGIDWGEREVWRECPNCGDWMNKIRYREGGSEWQR